MERLEILGIRDRLITTGLSVACAATFALSMPRSTSAEAQSQQKIADCTLRYPFLSDKWRACQAYVVDGVGSVLGYYEAGNSLNSENIFIKGAAVLAKHHLETRFFPPARAAIENRVTTKWPTGPNDTDLEVHFVTMNYNAKAGRAFVETNESNSVRHEGQELLTDKETQPHIAWHTLCRATQGIYPGSKILKPYSEWLITDNGVNTGRSCPDFRRALANGQIQ